MDFLPEMWYLINMYLLQNVVIILRYFRKYVK